MDFLSDADGNLKASKRVLLVGVLGLAALKIVSSCFHNYQLYEVDCLVRHIAHHAETEERKCEARRSATSLRAAPAASTPPSLAPTPSALEHEEKKDTTAAAAAAPPNPSPNLLHSSTPEAYVLPAPHDEGADARSSSSPSSVSAAAASVSSCCSSSSAGAVNFPCVMHAAGVRGNANVGCTLPPTSDVATPAGVAAGPAGTAAEGEGTQKIPESAFPVLGTVTAQGWQEAEGVGEQKMESPLSYFFFTTTSVHMASVDVGDTAADNSNIRSDAVDNALPRLALPALPAANPRHPRSSVSLPCASSCVFPLSAADRGDSTEVADDGGVGGGSVAPAAVASLVDPLPEPMVHLFIQPRWALAPSVSPVCTKWETFLRLHRISYTVHEVHVLRSDQPQAQSTDVPHQMQHVVDRSQQHGHNGAADAAAATEARVFADMLAETSVSRKVWERVQAGLHRVLPAVVLPNDLRTQYSLPFIMVGGTVLRGSFNDVIAELTNRGVVRQLSSEKRGDRDGGHGAVAAPSSHSAEEQRAIGQAVERAAEYTLRFLYEVGLLLEGSAVFSHYAAQLWSGHRYWDLLQIRRWFVYVWLAVPFLSSLKADVEKGLRARELGGLTREQLYESLQRDLVSLEQLLVASAETMPNGQGTEEGKTVGVHFLLGREPGPQDCALYAYLLPILRLSPRDIAHIGNPNFTYIYESRAFRGFVERMSSEAFPDLDVLLRPPRQPSLVMALSNIAMVRIEANTATALVALCARTSKIRAALHRSVCTSCAGLKCRLQQALMWKPGQHIGAGLQRVMAGCRRLTRDRRRHSSTDTAVMQTWWSLSDLWRAPRQTVAAEAAPDVTSSGEGASGAPRDDDHSSAVLRDGEHYNTRQQDVAEATAREEVGEQLAPPVMPEPAVHVGSSARVTAGLQRCALPQIAATPAAQQQPSFSISQAGPVSPRVMPEFFSVSPARTNTSAHRTDLPAHRTRSGSNTIMVIRRKGSAGCVSTAPSAPNQRTAGPGGVVASPSNAVGLRFMSNCFSAADIAPCFLGVAVEPGSAAVAKPRCSPVPRQDANVTAAASPTTLKVGELATCPTRSQRRVPRQVSTPTAPAGRTTATTADGVASDPPSSAERVEGGTSERCTSAPTSPAVHTHQPRCPHHGVAASPVWALTGALRCHGE